MQSNMYLGDDVPASLRSFLHSEDIPIQRSGDFSSTYESNHLQISQSPTREFLTKPISHHNCPDSNYPESPVCESVSPVASRLSDTTGEEMSSQHFVSPPNSERNREILFSKEKYNSVQSGVEKSSQDLPNPASCPVPEQSNPVSDPPTSGPVPPPDTDSMFYSFVILHVQEDHEEASRVCGVLQKLVPGVGTTFCEGFETPGVSPLSSLEEAVENSAYVVLLLTKSFHCKWAVFQTNVVLMNSIEDESKSGTVIPFYPILNCFMDKLPLCLRSLSPLKENAHNFHNIVQKTFKNNVIRLAYEQWNRKILEKQRKLNSPQCKTCDQLCADMPLLNINTLPSLLMQGQPVAIHINNVDNVQIGNQNIMNVHNPGNEPLIDMHGEGFEDELEAQTE